MQLIELSGNARQRGSQQGNQLRRAYQEMLDTFFSSELWRESKPPLLPDSIIRWALGWLGSIRLKKLVRRHLPSQYERVVGLGEGLGNGRFVWGVQFLEIMFCEAGRSLKIPGSLGCTQIHAQPKATQNGHGLLGRNYDFPNLLGPFQIVRRERPSERDRMATITVTQVPLIGTHQGVNENGLAVAANNARLPKGRDFNPAGIPYMLILQDILETCTKASEAGERLIHFPHRGNAGFIGFMDSQGECRIVEFTASRAAIRRPDDTGIIAQSNHFHAMPEANLPVGSCWNVEGMKGVPYAASTEARFQTADRLLRAEAGNITVDTLKSILRDHSANEGTGNDNTLCAHGLAGGTLASMIIDVNERSLRVAEGYPCENKYKEIGFG